MVKAAWIFPKKWFSILPLWLLLFGICVDAARTSRQASPCPPGSTCLVLTSCPDLLEILENLTPARLGVLQKATCGFAGRMPKVCCRNPNRDDDPSIPSQSAPTSPPTPPPTPSPTPAHNVREASPVTVEPRRTLGFDEDLLPKTCGLSFLGPRISRGNKVELGAYPWMAVLGFRAPNDDPNSSDFLWGCGGSLINKRYVLTAAHCALPRYNDNHTLTRVRLGEHNLKKGKDCRKLKQGGKRCAPVPQEFGIEEIVVHPDFNRRAPESDDIALLRLDNKVQFDEYVYPICLPEEGVNAGDFVGDQEATIAGWGVTKSGYSLKRLLATTVPHVPLKKCNKNYRNMLLKEQVCFGGVGFKDSCSGDSGGPLFHASHPGAPYTQLGIVSYGYKNCGTEGVASVYTNVGSYRNWIIRNMKP